MRNRQVRLGVVLALGAAGIASAAPITTTLRIEGPTETVLPATSVTLDGAAPTMTVRDTTDTDTTDVPGASALAQLAATTSSAGLALGFQNFAFGPQILRIGPAVAPGATPPFWRYKVNGKTADVGAHQQILRAGDSVTWALVSDFDARELDVAVSSDKVALGGAFTVTVRSVDNAGAATPSAGATVTYGGQSATATVDGTVTFATTAAGVQLVQATRAGEVRSPSRAVCAYGADPTVCSLPPAPPVREPKTDNVAPGSEIVAPLSGRTYRAVRLIRGTVGPDRSDVAGVEIALAKRVGTLCAFMGPKGYFGKPRPCTERRFVPARLSGANWVLVPRRTLGNGKYRLWSQATDGAGNRERVGIAPVNVIAFTIAAREVAR